ncbi:hypothetical protein FACS1894170_12440 [Planctomycetales bacterium]|nr:hypothetical protein FACS1894170_12440 [Planctomycetales bacterium]
MGWILVAGLILLNIGVVVETVDWNKRTASWIVYRIDPRYWSLYLIPILWGIVCWLATDFTACHLYFIHQKRYWMRFIIVLGVFCVFGSLGTGISIQQRIGYYLYYDVYMYYIIGPNSTYLLTGTWDWRMLITPVLVVVATAGLLYIAVKYRKPKS